jgi:hypothetical protein
VGKEIIMNTKVDIMVNGKAVRQYKHNGYIYIEAREGTEYVISIRNNSQTRKLAVITVDGLNVITGDVYDGNANQGYIIDAWSTVNIKGFRKDLNSVGAFKFCNKDKSYCNEQGLEGNNGVIGVRLYVEKPLYVDNCYTVTKKTENTPYYIPDPLIPGSIPMRWSTLYEQGLTNNKCNYTASIQGLTNNKCNYTASINSRGFDVGTTWGHEHYDKAREESFYTLSDDMYDEHIIYYDTAKNLKSKGVMTEKFIPISMPKAFGKFAEPPKGWRG